MSATADATQLAIERALDRVGITDPDQREAFADKFYRGGVSEFEEAAVRVEFEKVTRADIGRPPLPVPTDPIPGGTIVQLIADERALDLATEGPVNADGFDCDPYDPT